MCRGWTITRNYLAITRCSSIQSGVRQSFTQLLNVNFSATSTTTPLSRVTAAFEIFGNLEDQIWGARCALLASGIYHLQRRDSKAEEGVQLARDFFLEKDEQFDAARSRLLLGQIYIALNRHDDALEQLGPALDAFTTAGDQIHVAAVTLELGRLLLYRGDDAGDEEGITDRAGDLADLAQAMYEALGVPTGVADCLRLRGELQHLQCNYDDAARNLDAACEICANA